MKYRILAPIIFILGLGVIAFLMNKSEEGVPVPTTPTQSAPAPQQPTNDPFKNLKIP